MIKRILFTLLLLLLLPMLCKATAVYVTLSGNGAWAATSAGTGGHWKYNSGALSGYQNLQDGFDVGVSGNVSEITVNDSVNFLVSDYTLPDSATIDSVVLFFAANGGDGDGTVRVDICDGTNCTNGVGQTFSTGDGTYFDSQELYTLAPDGTSWDQTDFNALRIRFKLTANPFSATFTVQEMQILLYYTEGGSSIRDPRLTDGNGTRYRTHSTNPARLHP